MSSSMKVLCSPFCLSIKVKDLSFNFLCFCGFHCTFTVTVFRNFHVFSEHNIKHEKIKLSYIITVSFTHR